MEFNRDERISYWMAWDEPLTAAQASEMADSEEIDHVLAEIEGLCASLEGPLLAARLAIVKKTLAQIEGLAG